MKRVAISQSNYIPWKGYFDSIHSVDVFVLLDDVQFTRRDWRNRNKIKTKEGCLWLTIPVEVKGKFTQKINEVTIKDPHWTENHWNAIQMNYARAPYFAAFKDRLQALYAEAATIDSLSKINFLFLKVLSEMLEIHTPFLWSSDFDLISGKNERLVDLCKQLHATDYYTGPAARNYLDEALFRNENIEVHYFDYSGYPSYHQLHGDFVHEVSIIDLLLNEGPHAGKYMKSFNNTSTIIPAGSR